MKQVIEIEVPEGKKAVYKDGKITFIPKKLVYTDIKSISDAVKYLNKHSVCVNLLSTYYCLKEEYNLSDNIPYNSMPYEFAVICFRIVKYALEHITDSTQKNLTEGNLYYPIVQMCEPGYTDKCCGDKVVGKIQYKETEYYLVGSRAGNSSLAGLAHFDVHLPVSRSWADIGFRLFSNIEIAEYMSTQFGCLCFLVQFGGTTCDWKFIE